VRNPMASLFVLPEKMRSLRLDASKMNIRLREFPQDSTALLFGLDSLHLQTRTVAILGSALQCLNAQAPRGSKATATRLNNGVRVGSILNDTRALCGARRKHDENEGEYVAHA